MSVKAYILIATDPDHTAQLHSRLKKVKGIVEVHEVMGPYDIVAEVKAKDLAEVTDLLRKTIRPMAGVRNTTTCVAMN
jgi:DNA-binding Lrp family transcriptional regulator